MRVLKLGEKIVVEKYYKRVKYHEDNGHGWQQRMKEWRETAMRPTVGVIVGVRTVSNGRTDYEDDAGYIYSPKKFFRAILVSTSLYRLPILVPFETSTELIEKNGN
jgi:hypothetical protein